MTPEETQLVQFARWLSEPRVMMLFTLLTLWALAWKGVALWKAAKNSSKVWFIVFLVVNTIGILEIIYVFFFSKKKEFTK